jgi:Putative zinc-finger
VSSTMRSCKEIAALVVAREDRTLSMGERLELRAHMWICKACPGFEQQILTMRNALRQWRNYTGDGDAAESASKGAVPPADKAAK